MLFMLYSTYDAEEEEPERSWEEELSLAPETVRMLRRMLQFDEPYETVEELKNNIEAYLQTQ